jgi:DNA repair exonuclease SbcCD ATPase subunit
MDFKEFLSVLDLIKDPDTYAAKLAELQAQQAAIQASIDQLNTLGDIDKTRQAADAALEKAGSMVDAASAKAAQILSDAEHAFDKRHEELKAREVIADQALADYNTIKNQQTDKANELAQREKAIAAKEIQLLKQQEVLDNTQKEVADRLAKLKEVMG